MGSNQADGELNNRDCSDETGRFAADSGPAGQAHARARCGAGALSVTIVLARSARLPVTAAVQWCRMLAIASRHVSRARRLAHPLAQPEYVWGALLLSALPTRR